MNKYNDFLDKIKFINYNNKCEDIKKELLENKLASKICRDLVSIDAIEDILECDDIEGFIAYINNKIVGFVFFKHNYDVLYLSLIATLPKLGLPLGQILLTKMEEEVKEDTYLIQLTAIEEAKDFYEKMNYEVKYHDKDCCEYAMEKRL